MRLKLDVPKRFGKKQKHPFPPQTREMLARMQSRLVTAHVPRRSWVSMEQYRRTKNAPGIETMDATAFFNLLRDRKNLWVRPWTLDYFETLAYILFPKPNEKVFACILIWTLRDRFSSRQIADFLETTVPKTNRLIDYVMKVWEDFVRRGPLSMVDDEADIMDPDDLEEMVAREEAGRGNKR